MVIFFILLMVTVVAMLIASPFGILFANEDNGTDTVTLSQAVARIDDEFDARISQIITSHSYVDSVEIHYIGSPDNTKIDNWMDVIAIFAVQTTTIDELDVVTIDGQRIDLLRAAYWAMNPVYYYVETIVHTSSTTNEDGSISTDTTYEYILHIEISSYSADQQQAMMGFTQEQKDMLDELLTDEIRELIRELIS